MSKHFHAHKIVDVASETNDAITVTLVPDPDDAEAFRFRPGQHLTFRAMIDGEDVRRN